MIILKYQQPLLNYLGRMTGERELALDFTQEVFLKVHASLSSFQPRFKFSTWLFKIASNFMIDFWRKKKISAVSLDRTRDDGENPASLQVPDTGPAGRKKIRADPDQKEDRRRPGPGPGRAQGTVRPEAHQ